MNILIKDEMLCSCGRHVRNAVWIDLAKSKNGAVYPIIKVAPYDDQSNTFICDDVVDEDSVLLSFETEAFTKEEIETNGFEVINGVVMNAGAKCPYCNNWL